MIKQFQNSAFEKSGKNHQLFKIATLKLSTPPGMESWNVKK
jgi:hypothetical protein